MKAGDISETILESCSLQTSRVKSQPCVLPSKIISGSPQYVSLCSCVFSRVWLFATPWTVASQAPLFMGFLGQEYWSGWPFHPPGNLPDPNIEPTSISCVSCIAGGFFTAEPSGKECISHEYLKISYVFTTEYMQFYFFCFRLLFLSTAMSSG